MFVLITLRQSPFKKLKIRIFPSMQPVTSRRNRKDMVNTSLKKIMENRQEIRSFMKVHNHAIKSYWLEWPAVRSLIWFCHFGCWKVLRHFLKLQLVLHALTSPSEPPERICHWSKHRHSTAPWWPLICCNKKRVFSFSFFLYTIARIHFSIFRSHFQNSSYSEHSSSLCGVNYLFTQTQTLPKLCVPFKFYKEKWKLQNNFVLQCKHGPCNSVVNSKQWRV